MNAWFRSHRGGITGWLIIVAIGVAAKLVAEADPRFIGDWFVNITVPGQTVFVIWYSTKKPWRYPGPGRAVWVKATALALLLDVILIAKHWPWFPQLEFIAAYAEVLIAVGIYWQLASFARQRWELQVGSRANPKVTRMLGEVIDGAKAAQLLAREDASLAREDRQALRVLIDRLGVQADEAAASNARTEATAASVADDLRASHTRADSTNGPHGAAADAASQSGSSEPDPVH